MQAITKKINGPIYTRHINRHFYSMPWQSNLDKLNESINNNKINNNKIDNKIDVVDPCDRYYNKIDGSRNKKSTKKTTNNNLSSEDSDDNIMGEIISFILILIIIIIIP